MNCYFSDGERREVVVQHEALLGFAFEGFEALLVVVGAEGGGDQRLGFAAGEERRTVGAGQNADFDRDRRGSGRRRGRRDGACCSMTCSRKMRSRRVS